MEDKEQRIKLTYETNADETAKKVDRVNDSLEKTTKETENVGKAQKKSTGTTKDFTKGMEGLGGGVGSAITGFKALIKQMWLLVANPVGAVILAIVAGLTLLFKAFTSTKAGAEKFDQVIAGIRATIDVFRDRILKVADAIGKFFSGDFKGAVQAGKEAVSGFGEEVAAEFRKAADATKDLQQVADAMRDLGVARAELNRDLADTRELLTDENVAYEDKVKALNKIREAEGKQTEQELENARRRLKALENLASLSDTSAEDLQKIADARIAVFDLEKQQSDLRRTLNREEKRINNEEKSRLASLANERKARIKEQIALEKEKAKPLEEIRKEGFNAEKNLQKAIEDLEDDTEEKKLARQRQRAEEEIEILKQKGIDVENITRLNNEKFMILEAELWQKRQDERDERDRKAAEKEAEEQRKRDEEALEQQRIQDEARLKLAEQLEQSKFDITNKGLNLISLLAGKNKKIQKAAIIAEGAVGLARTVRSTAEGNASALAQGIVQAGPVAGPKVAAPAITANTVSGALSGATIIAQTAAALKALGGGGGGLSSASASNSTGGAVAATPQVDFQASSENQIANTIAQNTNEQPPIEAFIVESSVSSAQQLANNRITSNSL